MSNLPYDAEIEYLESTGTQYIDTGIKLFDVDPTAFDITLDVFVNTGNNNQSVILNAVYEVEPWPGMVVRAGADNKIYDTGAGVTNQIIGNCGTRATLLISRTNVSGNTHTINTTLFAGLDEYGQPFRFCNMKLYSLKITKFGILVRDFIPVRVGTKGYLYDKVTEQLFGNVGTGDFILGNDKALPNPFGFRRRLMMVGSGALPYDSEVEYLQTDGGQYLELPIYVNRGTDALEITYQQTSNTRQARFLHDGSATINFYVNGSDKYGLYTTAWQNPFNATIGTNKDIVKIDYKNKMFYVNNLAGSSTGNNTSTSASPLKIFGVYGNNPTAKARLFGFRFWRNEVLEMDCIPVRRNNEGYLYDKIGKRLYGNLGTGNFSIGADTGDISKFTRVDYIQNDSYAFIVVDIIPGYNTKAWYDFQINSGEVVTSGWWPVMFGTCNNVNPDRAFILSFPQDNDNYFNFDFGNIKVNTDLNFTNDRLVGYASKDEYTVNGDSYTMPSVSSFTCPTYMYIFYRPTTTVAYVHADNTSIVSWRGKCFGMKIWESDVLVRELVPVVNQLNVYGLYDLVNNKFYRSNSPATFTGGNLHKKI